MRSVKFPAAFFLFSFVLLACSKPEGENGAFLSNTLADHLVKNAKVIAGNKKLKLTWELPDLSNLKGIKIVRESDEKEISNDLTQEAVDNDVANGQEYGYRIHTVSQSGTISTEFVFVKGTPKFFLDFKEKPAIELVNGVDKPHKIGYSVSMDGERFATSDDIQNTAFIYKWTGNDWILEKKISKPDGTNQSFGWKVALKFPYLMVSDMYDDDTHGAVYVYKYNGTDWVKEQKITSGSSDIYGFGKEIKFNGNRLVVGVPAYTAGSSGPNPKPNAGAIFIYEKASNLWTLKQALLAGAPAENDSLGEFVDITDDKIFSTIAQYTNQSAVLYFGKQGNSWIQKQRISADVGDRFELGIATRGDDLAIGAVDADNKGCVYIYKFIDGKYEFVTKLRPEDGGQNADFFGNAISFIRDAILIGAMGAGEQDPTMGYNEGAAYTFNRKPDGTWLQTSRFQAPDKSVDSAFGFALSLNEDFRMAIIGAPSTSNIGAVYTYLIP